MNKQLALLAKEKGEGNSFFLFIKIFETFADQWTRDLFYCNHDFSVYSAHRTEGMMTWSEIKKERFNGYDVDPKTFVVIRTTAPA
jgi:hypothetical protein